MRIFSFGADIDPFRRADEIIEAGRAVEWIGIFGAVREAFPAGISLMTRVKNPEI